MFSLARGDRALRLRDLLVPVLATGGFVLLVWWFRQVDFYGSHFFDRGSLVILYNVLRVAFILFVLWLIYVPGAALLALVGRTTPLTMLATSERYALGFFAGAGAWHLVLLGVGLAGGYRWGIAVTVSLLVMFLSIPHIIFCIDEVKLKFRRASRLPSYLGTRKITLLLVLFLIAAAFLAIKGLYPAGGHDYYLHYFRYYIDVLRNGSTLPNDVWYHFFYSKGAGLYFLGMLLTDPLAPQLVATAFVVVGALTVATILNRAAPGTLLPVVGVILYVGFLIYTPGPKENMAHGGWGDLEKLHEPAAVLFLGIVWISSRMASAELSARRLWLTGLTLSIVGITLLLSVMAVVVGLFFLLLLAWGLWKRDRNLAWSAFVGAAVAGVTVTAVLVINYALTGLPLDQVILYSWPIVDLQKIDRWGVLVEILALHWALTGELANKVPLTWSVAPLLLKYLRLDMWWPVAVGGLSGVAWSAIRRQWRIPTSPEFRSTCRSLVAFIATLTILVVVLGIGRQQTISFYRFSTFCYAPVLCAALLTWASIPDQQRFRWGISVTLILAALALSALFGQRPLFRIGDGNLYQYAAGAKGRIRNIAVNARHFLSGRFSLRDAYQNQQGWPGRLPWGGIYPAMEQVWKLVGRGIPIYSLHVHDYCMLPDCRIYSWMSVATPDLALLGTPEEAVAAFKNAGINYFFISKELQIQSPVVRSPVLWPDTIARYLGVRWTDGTSYLLTWRENAEKPIDQEFINAYRTRIQESPNALSFPVEQFRGVVRHLRQEGLRPYRLPWCTTCDGMGAN